MPLRQKIIGLLQYNQDGNMLANKPDRIAITKIIIDHNRKRKDLL